MSVFRAWIGCRVAEAYSEKWYKSDRQPKKYFSKALVFLFSRQTVKDAGLKIPVPGSSNLDRTEYDTGSRYGLTGKERTK